MASTSRMRELTVGVLSPYLGGYYFGEVMTELHRNAQTMNVRLLSIRTGRREPLALPLAGDLVDGWIVVLDCVSPDQLDAMLASGKPVTSIAHDFKRPGIVSVESDNRRAINAAVDYLVADGHRAIGFVGVFREHDQQQRRIGFRTALARHGLPVRPELEVNAAHFGYAAGRHAAAELLARAPKVDAVLAGTDLLAAGIIDAFQEAGLRVPGDVAVIGYDNNSLSRTFEPQIATIDQNLTILTRVALDAICTRIRFGEQDCGTLLVENSFLPRASCGARAYFPADYPAGPSVASAQISFDAHANELNIGYEVTKDLISADFDKVLERMWGLAPFLEWACVGVAEHADDDACALLVQDVIDLRTPDSRHLLGQRLPPSRFPPLEHLPPVRFRERFVTLVPIFFNGTLTVLAVTGRLRTDAEISRYATLMHYVDLLSLALERSLVDDDKRRREQAARRLAEQLDHANHALALRVQAHTRSIEETNRELRAMEARLAQARQQLALAGKAASRLGSCAQLAAGAATQLGSVQANLATIGACAERIRGLGEADGRAALAEQLTALVTQCRQGLEQVGQIVQDVKEAAQAAPDQPSGE